MLPVSVRLFFSALLLLTAVSATCNYVCAHGLPPDHASITFLPLHAVPTAHLRELAARRRRYGPARAWRRLDRLFERKRARWASRLHGTASSATSRFSAARQVGRRGHDPAVRRVADMLRAYCFRHLVRRSPAVPFWHRALAACVFAVLRAVVSIVRLVRRTVRRGRALAMVARSRWSRALTAYACAVLRAIALVRLTVACESEDPRDPANLVLLVCAVSHLVQPLTVLCVSALALAIAAFARLTADGCIEANPGMTSVTDTATAAPAGPRYLVTGGPHRGSIVATWDEARPLHLGLAGGSCKRCTSLHEAERLRESLALPPPATTTGTRARSVSPARVQQQQQQQQRAPVVAPSAALTSAAPSPTPSAATRFWAVFHGRKRGVFLSWEDGALLAISGFPDALHRRFSSLATALDFACVRVVFDTFLSDGRVVEATAPPRPVDTSSSADHAPVAACTAPANLVSGLALATDAHARLTGDGCVEANPGPPAATDGAAQTAVITGDASPARRERKARAAARSAALKLSPTMTPDEMRYYNLPTRTNGQRQQHQHAYQWAANDLPKMKKNDIFFASWHEENAAPDELPHPTRHYTVTLLEPTENTITVRFAGAKKLVIDQWRCKATELGAPANTFECIFPLEKQYKESEETVCYMATSRTAYATTNTSIMWQRVLVTDPRPNFDRDPCSVLRRAAAGTDRDAFADRVTRIVAEYADAKRRNDAPALASVWHRFLSAPKMMLRCLKGVASSRLRQRYLQQQLAAVGCILEQTSTVTHDRLHDDGGDENSRPDEAKLAEEKRCKKRLDVAKRHATNGFASKGAAHLQQDELPAQSAATMLKNLRDLHPQGTANDQPIFAARPTDKLPLNISNADLLALIKSSITGAAPGSTAWTEEMLFDVCHFSNTALCGIKLMLADIINDDAPACVRERLLTSELLGIPKPDGSTRPIALTEVMLKIASKLAIAAELKTLKNRFKETQFGVCAPRGTDTVIFATRDFIRHAASAQDAASDSTKCVVTIDFKNAFNCPSRRMMVDAIAPFPYLLSMFRFEYASPSKLFVRGAPGGEHVMSSCGTRQGSTLGPVFFCLAIQNMLDDVNRMPGVRAMAYMDDLTIHAQTFDDANAAYSRILEHCRSLSLSVNTKKCEIMSHVTPDDNICPQFARVKVVKLLGASIGLTDALEKEHLEKRYDNKFAKWFDTLIKGYGPWATTVLGLCGIPKLSYIVRNHHPSVTKKLASAFDQQVERTWSTWADCRTDDITQSFAHLPIKLGGLGFTRQQQVASCYYDSARAQYEGAICAAAPPLVVQGTAVMQVNIDLARKLDAHGAATARHRHLCMQNGTTALFRDPKHEARDASFGAALRYRLFAPHANCPDRLDCPGCTRNCDAREFQAHAPSCTRIHGYNASSRHASIKQAWMKIFRRYLIPYQMQEPRDMRLVECPGCKQSLVQDKWRDHAKTCQLWDDSAVPPEGSGPDIRIFLSDRPEFTSTVIDVTCIGLENASHSSAELRVAFRQIEEKKRKLYGKLCADNNTQLIIAAISDSGIPSAETTALLRAIIAHSTDSIHDVVKELQAAAVEANGASLYNAECRAGIPHAHRTREAIRTTFSLIATPAAATAAAAMSSDSAPVTAAAAIVAPPSTPAPPALLGHPVPPPLRVGLGWVKPPVSALGRPARQQREDVSAPSRVGSDGADTEPEPVRPQLCDRDVDGQNRLRHGKSPIPPSDDHVWDGRPNHIADRKQTYGNANPALAAQIVATLLMLQTHCAGVYFTAGLFLNFSGPPATMNVRDQSDKHLALQAVRDLLPNIRAVARIDGVVDSDGIILPLTRAYSAFYGQARIDAHFNSKRSVDELGNDNGPRVEHALRGDAA